MFMAGCQICVYLFPVQGFEYRRYQQKIIVYYIRMGELDYTSQHSTLKFDNFYVNTEQSTHSLINGIHVYKKKF